MDSPLVAITGAGAKDVMGVLTSSAVPVQNMEDFVLDVVIGKGPAARSLRLVVPRFTLVGATTREPYTRAHLAKTQPGYYQWLAKLFDGGAARR